MANGPTLKKIRQTLVDLLDYAEEGCRRLANWIEP